MMRVAITVEQSWAPVPGGIARSTNELAGALVARGGLDLVGVAAAHRGPPPPDWVPPVPVRQLPLPRRALHEAWHRLRWPPVERATGPVDLVHGTNIPVPACRAPLVLTIHDLAFRSFPDHFTGRGNLFFRRALALALRHARLVTCPSRATFDECLAAGFEPDRLRHVPWGVRGPAATPADVDEVRRRFGLDRPYALFCGTIEPRKNLGRLLEAFVHVEHADLMLVIAGPRGWTEDIGPGLDRLGPRGRWLGAVPRSHLAALYAGAEVTVYPSLAEGFGLPVLEAMLQGTPVVTSIGTAMEEVAADAALLVDPFDVSAIAEAIDRAVGDAELAGRLADAGRARAASYTWDRTAERMQAVYDEAVGTDG